MINRTEALDDILHTIHGKLGEIKIIPICSKAEQTAKRVIVCARKDSKAPLVLYNPLIVHDINGNYTDAAQKILRGGESFFGK